MRLAKQCFTRKKRQDFRKLLDELEVFGSETEEAEELADAVFRIKQTTERQDAALDTVSKALLDSGMLGEDRLRRTEQEYAEKCIQERTAELQAKIAQNNKAIQEETRQTEKKLKDLQLKLQKEEAEQRAKLAELLKAEKTKTYEEIETERSKLQKDRAELERQELLLKGNLQKVTQELREAGDDVVNRYLAIAPLLASTSQVGQQTHGEANVNGSQDSGHTPPAEIELPFFITASSLRDDSPLTEKAFFDRFRNVVDESGFTYRPFDLQRFHLSVKCGDLTVLGGPSGTPASTQGSHELLGQAAAG